MEVNSFQQMVVVTLMVVLMSMSAHSRYPFSNNWNHRPRCSTASQPCRLQAVMHTPNSTAPNVISTLGCTCPDSVPSCSDDWENDSDKMVVRELITDGNVQITLSMMFCVPVQVQSTCNPAQVALRLAGYSYIPTEVDFINCRCSDERPLVVYEKSHDDRYRQLVSYVCSSHKPQCSMQRNNRDHCITEDHSTGTTTYPCRCPTGSSCTYFSTSGAEAYYACQRTRRSARKTNF